MSKFVALQAKQHGFKKWLRPEAYQHASAHHIAPLCLFEATALSACMPLAFLPHGSDYLPIAVCGVEPGVNLYVLPPGHWIGPDVPAVFRAHPFELRPAGDSGQWVMCVDEASGLVVESSHPQGVPFFAEVVGAQPGNHEAASAKLSPDLQRTLNFLMACQNSRLAARRVGNALSHMGLLEPWEFQIKLGERAAVARGLLKINAKALAEMPDTQFLELRKLDALPLVYAQLGSLERVKTLEQMAALQQRAKLSQLQSATPAQISRLPSFSFSSGSDELIKFT